MEQNNKTLTFKVIGDELFLAEAIFNYNKVYGTDFEILEIINDEVPWIKLKVSKYEILDIFQLGFQYGGFIELKRIKGEINW